MNFPGGSNARENLLPFKYTRKSLLNSYYLVVSKMDLNVGTEEMYDWLLGSCSVRLFYKLYEALFVCSTSSTFVLYV